jgi:hypothetical protein
MSNSYQRAKARVKELEEQNLLIQRELSAYKESDAQLSNDLCNANHKLKDCQRISEVRYNTMQLASQRIEDLRNEVKFPRRTSRRRTRLLHPIKRQ